MSFYKKCVLGANSFCKSLWCLSFCPVVGCRKYVVDAPMHSIRKTKHRCNIPFCKKQSFCKKNVVRNTSVNSRQLLVAILFTAHFLRPPHHSVLVSPRYDFSSLGVCFVSGALGRQCTSSAGRRHCMPDALQNQLCFL